MWSPIVWCILGVVRTRFILTDTHHAGNVGGAARAMKTMGFDELVLVAPRDLKVLNRKRTKEAASGAMDVLQNAQIYETLEQALENTTVRCATGMPHDMSRGRTAQRYSAPRSLMETVVQQQESAVSIAFVFGNEILGMTKQDIDLCHVVLGIPTNPKFASLNLASAVQLIAYDWRQALGGYTVE